MKVARKLRLAISTIIKPYDTTVHDRTSAPFDIDCHIRVSCISTRNRTRSAQLQCFRTKANENTTAGVENGKHGQISWDTQISWRYFLLRSKNPWSASSYLKRILMGWLNFDLTWKRVGVASLSVKVLAWYDWPVVSNGDSGTWCGWIRCVPGCTQHKYYGRVP